MISPYVEKDPTKFCDYDSFVLGASTLKKFCMLRAESVNGQLCGTISSSDSQSSLSSAVDASGINISDMGTMSMGGKGGMANTPGNERPQKNPNQQIQPEAIEPAEDSATAPDAEVQTSQPQPPQMNGEMPDYNGQIPPDLNGQSPEVFSPPNGVNPFGNGSNPTVNNNQSNVSILRL